MWSGVAYLRLHIARKFLLIGREREGELQRDELKCVLKV